MEDQFKITNHYVPSIHFPKFWWGGGLQLHHYML